MPLLSELARYVRSKNAGPFWVTIDIFFDDSDRYQKAEKSPSLDSHAISALYGVPSDTIHTYRDPQLNVIKISFPRPVVAGNLRDRDAHAGQMFVPLLQVNVV